jgi:MFS family permease
MDILKRKDFRRLMVGKATSMLGSNMQQFALSLYVLGITGSAAIFASMLALSILPRILLSPVAGVFGDWFDRKKMIVRLDLLNAFLIGGYALYYYLNSGLSLLSIYILVILLETIEIFFGSAMSAVVPSMIEQEKLFEANSIRSVINSLANIASPMLASALYAFVGLQSLLLINALSFMLSALMEQSIEFPKHNKKPEKINFKLFKQDLWEGILVIKEHKILLNTIAFGIFLNFSLNALFSVVLVFLLFNVLGVTEIQYGLFTTIIAFSMLLGPIVFGKKAQQIDVGKLVISTFSIISILIFIVSFISTDFFLQNFSSSFVPFIAIATMVFLIAMLTTLTNIALGTLFDTLVPKEFLGRVSSVMNLGLMAAIPLGQMLFGFCIDYFSASFTISAIGFIILGATLYFRKPFLKDNIKDKTKEAPCNLDFSHLKAKS